MKIGFIGAGKVGFTLGKYMTEHDVHVSGYYSQNIESAKEASQFTGSKCFESLDQIISNSDVVFLTVPDGKISEVWNEIKMILVNKEAKYKGKYFCHCSGALSSAVFSDIEKVGAIGYSIHPLFAICDKLQSYQEISKAFFTIEYSTEKGRECVHIFKDLFEKIGNKVSIITADNKVKYHASAVFASNLVVGLYSTAANMLKECGFDEESSKVALLPLFINNCDNIAKLGTEGALTGPVERGDLSTVEKHLRVLSEQETNIYCELSKKIIEVAKNKNPDRDYSDLEKIL